jgi:hypothetical protein
VGKKSGFSLLKIRQHTGQDFQSQIFFITQAIGSALKHSYFRIKSLDKTERDFVLWQTESSDAIPMTFDESGKLFKRLESLPS